jgi:hypothetical protein
MAVPARLTNSSTIREHLLRAQFERDRAAMRERLDHMTSLAPAMFSNCRIRRQIGSAPSSDTAIYGSLARA